MGVGQEVLAGGQQEGAEAALGGVHCPEVVLLEEPGEEFLGQVGGSVRVVAPTTNEGVERIPVRGAERGAGIVGLRRAPVSGGQDEAPARRRERRAVRSKEAHPR